MANYGNSKKNKKVSLISSYVNFEDTKDTLTIRSKFNFHYFTKQDAGQDFSDWGQLQLTKLLDKLKNYSENTLKHWTIQPVGKGIGHILEIYGKFPSETYTEFTEPRHIPVDAQWGRFRLESKVRLIGFVIPEKLHDQFHPTTGQQFDKNTFYVVFLDKDHRFYSKENN